MPTGFLLIDKEENWTSHDVVANLRIVTNIKKIGHAGTLDPFATGLLIVGIGREATKRLDLFKNLPKTYEAKFILGATSDTQDKTGIITQTPNPVLPSEILLKDTLNSFLGKSEQKPPMYSAKKINGKKLYKLARRGEIVERETHEITIDNIELISYDFESENPTVFINLTCSSGTYIRTIVHDIGKKLSTGAYTKELRRISIGKYNVSDAHKIKEITRDNWSELTSNLEEQYNLEDKNSL